VYTIQAPEFGFSVSPEVVALAKESKDIVLRSMVTIPLAKFDPLLSSSRQAGKSILGGWEY